MSKRPTAGTSTFSRLRMPMGWLRNAPIWSKLGLIMVVPTIATVIVGLVGLVGNVDRASDADRARLLAGLAAETGTLVHELQNERAEATTLLGAPNDGARVDFDRQAAATDDALRRYRVRRAALANLPTDFRGQLVRIDGQLTELAKLREQIKGSSQLQNAGEPTTLSNVIFRYLSVIQDLTGLRGSAAQITGDVDLGADMRAAAALAQTKEFLAEERVVVLQALLQHSMPTQLRVQFIGKLTGQEQALQQFEAVAPQAQRDLFEKTVSGADRREADNFQSTISSLTSDELPPDIFTPAQWDAAMIGQAALIRKVEATLDNHIIDDALALHTRLQRQVFLETGLLLGMLLLSIMFAWMVARSMARSLRELRHGALTVAQYGLPQAVARLRDPQLATQASPQQLALQIAEPLPVRSRDEFGQVAEAFNAVHLEAVRTAAEQAALRASVATMFVNLARRSQILVDRLIGHLDRLERGEEDPDRLSELFQLDHLATRMRRNDENLLVLAGADSTRIQRDPAPLMDVLRAAQSEVEHYTRIEFGMIDRDVEIGAHAVNDMVHLIAELLDNATAFSPPDSAVVVEARRVGDRAVLLVEDRGIGISPDQMAELNERLANPPVVDVAVSRMMGLVVVARLATRHGVKVELRPARERGTIADLTLPVGVLVPRALAGRGGVPVAGSRDNANVDNGPAPSRSLFGAPLALESGPSGGPPARDPAGAGSGLSGFGPPGGGLGAALNGTANGAFGSPAGPPQPRQLSDGVAGLFGGARPAGGPPNGNGFTGSPPPNSVRGGPPAWSDLVTGAETVQPPIVAPADVERLPRRRAVQPPAGDAPDDGQRPAGPGFGRPGQPGPSLGQALGQGLGRRPTPPERQSDRRPMELPGPPPAAAPHRNEEVVERSGGSPPVAPPAWPPVPQAAEHTTGVDAPQVPESFAAALDMTAEMPRVRLDWDRSVDEPASQASTGGNGGAQQRFADETMELPIFRELESAWFRPPTAPGSGPPPMPPGSEQSVASQDHHPVEGDQGVEGTQATGPDPRESAVAASAAAAWQTSADEGWDAASALAEEHDFTTTTTGLPKRVPMSQLVPGGVEKGTVSAHKRTPEAVRGLLSAYHRGVQRGRTDKTGDSKTPEHTTAGPQGSQGGKEHEA